MPTRTRFSTGFSTGSWRDMAVVLVPAAVILLVGAVLAIKLVRPAPPNSIRMVSGPEGSGYRSMADKYKKIIEAYGVKVEIVSSRGALDNLQLLASPAAKVDVGFVQGGLTDGVDISRLDSLGSVFAQPLMVYYRAEQPIEILSGFKGKRLAIGAEGSGTRVLALKLLKANDLDASNVKLIDAVGDEAARQLVAGSIDAAFLMGDSATPKVMRSLREVPGIRLMSFRQAEGYVRKMHFLTHLTLPEGAMDLGRDYPPETVQLVGPTVELVARHDLHPALSDLLISAAREVHGGPGLYRNAGEYPAPLERDFPISREAERYYKSGGQFLYKHLPFWLASLIDRLLVLVLPLLVLILPATRVAPSIYRWRMRYRIYRWYGALMAIEREMQTDSTPEKHAQIATRLDEIVHAVNEIKTPLSFADQLYVLRDHVGTVRRRLLAPDAAG